MLDSSPVPSARREPYRVLVISKRTINRIYLRTRLSRRYGQSISLLAVRPGSLEDVAFADACHRVPLLNISQPFSPDYPSFYASAYPELYWDEAARSATAVNTVRALPPALPHSQRSSPHWPPNSPTLLYTTCRMPRLLSCPSPHVILASFTCDLL